MDLDFTEEQEMLRKMARDFLKTEVPKSAIRDIEESDLGYSPEIWKKMAELGWQGLVIPEQLGGTGMTFFDLCLIIEEMGRNICPGPFISTAVCAMAILDAGTEQQKKAILPKVASGEAILTLAFTEPSGSWKVEDVITAAKASGSAGYTLDGVKLFVPDAHVATHLLVVARSNNNQKGAVTVFIVDPKAKGVKIESQLGMGLDNKCEVVLKGVSVTKDAILGKLDDGAKIVEKALMRGAAAKVAEMSGGCQASLEMANAYAKERVQYGRPIGSFQVIQHYLADVFGKTDRTKNLAWEVCWKVSAGVATPLDVSAAKAWAGPAYKWVTERCVQVHGAIGTTRDHDMGLYYRRALVQNLDYGDEKFHREIVAQQMGL